MPNVLLTNKEWDEELRQIVERVNRRVFMPKFLERKLKSEYGAKSDVPYKVMNAIGAMKGNKETEKGRAMEARHEAHQQRQARSAERKRKHG